MKPIGNIFGFDCGTCEHNRHCYGGNMGNQFRYCQKSAEKIQSLDNLEIKLQRENKILKENKQLKERIKYLERSNNRREDTIIEQRHEIIDLEDNWNKLKEYIRENIIYDDVGMKILDPSPLEDYIQELEQGSDSND